MIRFFRFSGIPAALVQTVWGDVAVSDEQVPKDAGSRVKTAAQQAESLATALADLHVRLLRTAVDVEAEEVRRLRDHTVDLERRMQRLEERARRLQFRLDRARS